MMNSKKQKIAATFFIGRLALCCLLLNLTARANLIPHGASLAAFDLKPALDSLSSGSTGQEKIENTKIDESLRRGDLLYDESRFQEAIKEYEKALALFNEGDDKAKLGRVYLQIGKSYESLRGYKDAAKWYRKVLDMGEQAGKDLLFTAARSLNIVNTLRGYDSEAAEDKSDSQAIKAYIDGLSQEKGISLRELRSQAIDLILRRKAEEAIALIEKGLKEYEATKKPAPPNQDSPDQSELINKIQLHNVLATAHFRLGNYDKSVEHLQAVLSMEQAMNYQSEISTSYTDLGFVYYSKRELATAEKYLRQALDIQKKIESPEIWQTYHLLAKLCEEQDRLSEANKLYDSAIEKVEMIRGGLVTDETKVGFLSQAVEPFQSYVAFLLERKPEPGYQHLALDLSERSRARALSDLIGRASQNQNTAGAGSGKPFTFGERYSPQHSKPWNSEQIIRFVTGGATTYLSYYVAAKKIYACVINPLGELKWVALPASKSELSKLVIKYREKTDAPAGGGEEESKALFSYLIAPVLPLIKGRADKVKLTILPHGDLNLVPFSALLDDRGRPFGLDREVTYLPSFTIAGELTKRNVGEKSEVLLIGKPESTEGLRYSLDEVGGVSKIFGERQSLILAGKAATREKVMAEMERHSYILFSTHGSADENNRAVFYLALADGQKLTQNDINRLKLKADLVALSACRTHKGSLYSGDELMSLSRSFFSSGAKYVLATLWEVEDRASSEIIQDFFALLKRGNSPAQSLRLAQLQYWDRQQSAGEVNARRRRAYFWAPWILLGRNE